MSRWADRLRLAAALLDHAPEALKDAEEVARQVKAIAGIKLGARVRKVQRDVTRARGGDAE